MRCPQPDRRRRQTTAWITALLLLGLAASAFGADPDARKWATGVLRAASGAPATGVENFQPDGTFWEIDSSPRMARTGDTVEQHPSGGGVTMYL